MNCLGELARVWYLVRTIFRSQPRTLNYRTSFPWKAEVNTKEKIKKMMSRSSEPYSKRVVDNFCSSKYHVIEFRAIIKQCKTILSNIFVKSSIEFVWRQINEVANNLTKVATSIASFPNSEWYTWWYWAHVGTMNKTIICSTTNNIRMPK
jgi:hypothetical protein